MRLSCLRGLAGGGEHSNASPCQCPCSGHNPTRSQNLVNLLYGGFAILTPDPLKRICGTFTNLCRSAAGEIIVINRLLHFRRAGLGAGAAPGGFYTSGMSAPASSGGDAGAYAAMPAAGYEAPTA